MKAISFGTLASQYLVERGGDYVFPVKDNQKALREDIETAFNEPVFPPVLMG